MIDELDQTLSRTRQAFWSCWSAHCADLGHRDLDHRQALREKDWWGLNRHLIQATVCATNDARASQAGDLFKALAGMPDIDGGQLVACGRAFEQWVVPVYPCVRQRLARYPFEVAGIVSFVDELQHGDAQRTDQQCRDAMEMAMRPR